MRHPKTWNCEIWGTLIGLFAVIQTIDLIAPGLNSWQFALVLIAVFTIIGNIPRLARKHRHRRNRSEN